MRTKLIGLIVGLVGCSAAFFCSCKKGCGISYVPEVLTDEQFSGAGYAQDFVPQEGELVFSVSSPSAANVLLTIRGLGKAEAEIVSDGLKGFSIKIVDEVGTEVSKCFCEDIKQLIIEFNFCIYWL